MARAITPPKCLQQMWDTKCLQHLGSHNAEETNIHELSRIRTPNPSNQAFTDLRLRPHGHRDREKNTEQVKFL